MTSYDHSWMRSNNDKYYIATYVLCHACVCIARNSYTMEDKDSLPSQKNKPMYWSEKSERELKKLLRL